MPASDVPPQDRALLKRSESLAKKRRGGAKIPKSKHKQRQLDQRARWAIREWDRDPTKSYGEMVEDLCERFAIGRSSAENACARANEMLSEVMIDHNVIERHWQRLAMIGQAAFEAGKYHAAIRAVMAQAELGGLLDRVPEINIGNVQQFAHLQIVSLTPTQRSQREQELFSAAELRATQAVKPANADGPFKMPIASVVDEDFSLPFDGGRGDDDE